MMVHATDIFINWTTVTSLTALVIFAAAREIAALLRRRHSSTPLLSTVQCRSCDTARVLDAKYSQNGVAKFMTPRYSPVESPTKFSGSIGSASGSVICPVGRCNHHAASWNSECTLHSRGRQRTNRQLLRPAAATISEDEFALRVEEGIKGNFGGDSASRIIATWKHTCDGRLHESPVTIASGASDENNNQDMMMQQCNSYVEGLNIRLFHDTGKEPFAHWVSVLENGWQSVRDELEAALADSKTESRGNNVWAGPRAGDDVAEAYGAEWKTLGLFDRAEWDEENVVLFPKTCQLLQRSGVPLVEALFARMGPGSSIQPHSDMSNFVLTAHLGIDVPAGKCWLQVGDERRYWENGKMMVFDTSIIHAAANEANVDRYVLMLRIWHPDLTSEERQGLQFIFDCLNDPNLVVDPEIAAQYPALAAGREEYYRQMIADL